MSTRWMAVQYIGDILRIPVVNEPDMDMPFGSSTLERDVRRIVVNPFSDSPQVFVPEAENAKLRERVEELEELLPENGRWFSAEVVEAYVAEIKKLRELVREMYKFMSIAEELNAHIKLSPNETCSFAKRLHELGVDDGV